MGEQVTMSDDTQNNKHKSKRELNIKSPTVPISHVRTFESFDSTQTAKQLEDVNLDENEGKRQNKLPVNKVQPMTKHSNTQILLPATEKLNHTSTTTITETTKNMQVEGNSTKSKSATNARTMETNETRLRELLFGNKEDQPSFVKDYYPILVANKPSQPLQSSWFIQVLQMKYYYCLKSEGQLLKAL